jgi:hypothetical protein
MGFGDIPNNINERQASILRHFRKICSQILVLNCIKTAVNMEETRPRYDRQQIAYTLIPPKRRKNEDQNLNGRRKSIMPWRKKDRMKHRGNGWRKVATGKQKNY